MNHCASWPDEWEGFWIAQQPKSDLFADRYGSSWYTMTHLIKDFKIIPFWKNFEIFWVGQYYNELNICCGAELCDSVLDDEQMFQRRTSATNQGSGTRKFMYWNYRAVLSRLLMIKFFPLFVQQMKKVTTGTLIYLQCYPFCPLSGPLPMNLYFYWWDWTPYPAPVFPPHSDLRPYFLPFLLGNLNGLQRRLEEVSEKKPASEASLSHNSNSSSSSTIISAPKSQGYLPALDLCDDLPKPAVPTWKPGRWVLGLQVIPCKRGFVEEELSANAALDIVQGAIGCTSVVIN